MNWDHLENKKEFKTDHISFIPKMLCWASQFRYFHYFNHHNIPYPNDAFPHMLTISNVSLKASCLEEIDRYMEDGKGLCGFLSYDLKNQFYPLKSPVRTDIPFPDFDFYCPEIVIEIDPKTITIHTHNDPTDIFQKITNTYVPSPSEIRLNTRPNSRTTKTDYLRKVKYIQEQILQGEFYEINYCIAFNQKVTNARFDTIQAYLQLCNISPMPFSVLMKYDHKWVLSASPERFLKKTDNKIISQPIKGTIKRGKTNQEDEQLKKILRNSEKELAENMMIVDLVRNDLSRCAQTGSVHVDELFGIYAFKNVHQMISTVSATLKSGITFSEIIRNTFPMGSMTGAPKLRVMQETDALEDQCRGIYSGAIGFIDCEGNFDFNVVIRSFIYDQQTQALQFQVGSAITYDAEASSEYEECLLKAAPLFQTIS